MREHVVPAFVALCTDGMVGSSAVLVSTEVRQVARRTLDELDASTGRGGNAAYLAAASKLAACGILLVLARTPPPRRAPRGS